MTLAQEIKKIKSQLELNYALYKINLLALNYFNHLDRLYERSKKPRRIQTLSQACEPVPGTLHEIDRNRYIRENSKQWSIIQRLSDIDEVELDAEIYNRLIQYPANSVPTFSEEEKSYFRFSLEEVLEQFASEYNELHSLLQTIQQAQEEERQRVEEEEMTQVVITEMELAELDNQLKTLQAEFFSGKMNAELFNERMIECFREISFLVASLEPGNPDLPEWLTDKILELAALEEDNCLEYSFNGLQESNRSASVDSSMDSSSSSSAATLDTQLEYDSESVNADEPQESALVSFSFFGQGAASFSSRKARVFFEI